jgi:transposase
MIPGIHLDYKELRRISPGAARRAILQILKSTDGNVAEAARLLHTTRRTIYKALKKNKGGNLDDCSTAPKSIWNRTAEDIEEKVIEIKAKTRYGPLRIVDELKEQFGITLSHHTIRNIVRRNKKKLKLKEHKPHKKGPRPFVDWYSAKPFEVVQIDLKHVVDQKALSMEQITHVYACDLPLYQWGAIDVNSRFKLIAYSNEKTWTNGLTWFLWVTSWIRSHGMTGEIVYTVDHGEEFGGKSWLKMTELRHLLKGFGCRLIQNHLKHPEENSHLERSHRTDDDEFYIPRILSIKNRQEFYREALNYIYYYNNVRKHSSLQKQTPFQYLLKQMPTIDDRIRIVPPLFLDNISVDLGPWSGYHLLAQHQKNKNFKNNVYLYLK